MVFSLSQTHDDKEKEKSYGFLEMENGLVSEYRRLRTECRTIPAEKYTHLLSTGCGVLLQTAAFLHHGKCNKEMRCVLVICRISFPMLWNIAVP